MNFNNEKDVARLWRAIEHGRKQLKPFRDTRERFIRDYVGPHYHENASKRKIIVNHMNQVVDTYAMMLSANRPRVLVSSDDLELAGFSNLFQLSVNKLIEDIELEDVIAQCVMDAYFTVGIRKVYMADAGQIQLADDTWADPGRPYAECLSFDNWFHDTEASDRRRWRFCGDRYRVSYEKLLDDDLYDRRITKHLQPSHPNTAELDDQSRAENISRDTPQSGDRLEETIELFDVWEPETKRLATFVWDSPPGKPLSIREWEGPDQGPYDWLTFQDVPDQSMPVSPAMNLKELFDTDIALMNKQVRQAKRQKDVGIYEPSGAEDANRLQRSQDGEFIQVKNKEAIDILKMGGADPGNQAFELSLLDKISRAAGNLDALAGLGPQANTLGQDQMIRGQVSERMAKMQYRVVRFTERLCRDLGWMLWKDQVREMPLQMEIPGVTDVIGSPTPTKWEPGRREGGFDDYRFKVEPHSQPYKSPSERVGGLNQLLTQIYIPMLPMLQQSGGSIDLQELTGIYAEMMDMPRLRKVVKFANPTEATNEPQPGQEEQRQAPVTTRNNVRHNVPTSGTDASRRQTQMAMLMDGAGQANQDQMAAAYN